MFYYNNNDLVKRVVAGSADWVDIDQDGIDYVNDVVHAEPNLVKKALGEMNIELPYQVPNGMWFVMGNHRSVSVDSRSAAVGCVAQKQNIEKIVFHAWPLERLEAIHWTERGDMNAAELVA